MKSLNPCHSEASNISAMSTKEEEEESGSKHETTMSRVVLDLKLANNESMNKRNPSSKLLEFNLLNSPNEGKSKSSKSKTFTCSFCGREFPTSQALGGHQNAHKQERALAKNRHNMGDVTAVAAGAPPPYGHPQGYSYYPYSSTFHHNAPNSFGDLNRSHGVRAGPMIHKPYSYHQPSSSSSSSFAHSLACEKMTRAYLMSPSSSSRPDDGLKGENLQPRGLGMDKFCASLNLGVNPNPTTIVFFDSATTKADDEGGDDEKHQRLTLGNIVDDGNDASGVLDLDLKL